MAYTRVGVDLSLGGGRAANGAATSPAPAGGAGPALSVRDAPTINSLIARRHAHLPHARVDALLERLAPSPVSPHSVIVHSRAAPTPSPPSSNEVTKLTLYMCTIRKTHFLTVDSEKKYRHQLMQSY